MNIAVIQARMASKRLPRKALMLIDSFPMIYHVIKRAQKIRGVEKVILATSINKDNDGLADFARTMNIEVFRGDEDNVLERFYVVAKTNQAEHIVRLTGDNPLVDFTALSFLLKKHCANNNDYSCMTGLPIGASGEVFSFNALETSYLNADGKKLCDHIDLYVLENQDRFKIVCYEFMQDLSLYKWTVDDKHDMDIMERFFSYIKGLTNVKIEGLDTKALVIFVQSSGFQKDMQSLQVNISEKNIYSIGLIKKIIRRVPVQIEEAYCER